MENLHRESLWLTGARDFLLRLEQIGVSMNFGGIGKEHTIYRDAVTKALMENRDNLLKFMQGASWQYYDHQRNAKGKLISVKVKFT